MDIKRDSYRDIQLYSPNRASCEIDLSDNTNLWGIPPRAARAIGETAAATVTRYPALYASGLKDALANYAGVSADMIVTGCGSDDVLDSAIRAFADPGDMIAYPNPSFPMIPIFAKMNGLKGIPVPLNAEYGVDPDVFLSTGARIIYLCSPNNPTGASFSKESIDTIVRNAKGIVIVDEAYAEFADRSITVSGNVLVTRTMSKAFGLAGLRVGYAIGASEIVTEVEKSRGPYKVNAIAERAAIAALTQDIDWVREKIAEVRINRAKLIDELKNIGLNPLPSDSNFVMVPVNSALRIDNDMRKLGVAVRPFSNLPNIGDALRISIGPWNMMERCLTALKEVL